MGLFLTLREGPPAPRGADAIRLTHSIVHQAGHMDSYQLNTRADPEIRPFLALTASPGRAPASSLCSSSSRAGSRAWPAALPSCDSCGQCALLSCVLPCLVSMY